MSLLLLIASMDSSGNDVQTDNWIARSQAAGYTPTDTEILAANTYLTAIRAAGLRTKIRHRNLLATGGGSTSALIPLINDDGFAPVALNMDGTNFVAGGVICNGSDEYINTQTPQSVLSVSDSHLMVAARNLTGATTRSLIGARVGATTPAAMMRWITGGTSSIAPVIQGTGTAGGPSGADVTTTKIAHGSSVSSTDLRAFTNGAQVGSTYVTARAGTLTAEELFVMGRNSSGAIGEISGGTLLTYGWGLGLTTADVAADAAAIEAALDVLGRGVI